MNDENRTLDLPRLYMISITLKNSCLKENKTKNYYKNIGVYKAFIFI